MTYLEAEKAILKHTTHKFCPGLGRIRLLNSLANFPDKDLKFIHVAGTNGKGSTAVMIATILIEAGYRVGLYISPCLQVFNERFQINGNLISDSEVLEIANKLEPLIKKMPELPTEFELITEIAFVYFKKHNCDFVVLEAGLGGRFDATNAISCSKVSVITSLGLDHTQYLGNTLEKIAYEKAGIIKKNSHVVLYNQNESVCKIIKKICNKSNSELSIVNFDDILIKSETVEGQSFDGSGFSNLFLPLLGIHQVKNTFVAINAIKALQRQEIFIKKEEIYSGLSKTFIPARFEIVNKRPLVILDGGHNPQCFEALFSSLKKYFYSKKFLFIIGVLADKDYKNMIYKIQEIINFCYVVTPNCSRGLKNLKLCEYLKSLKIKNAACDTISSALDLAIHAADSNTIICCTGSLYIASEVRDYFGLKPWQKLNANV